jgi:hypothetical protein
MDKIKEVENMLKIIKEKDQELYCALTLIYLCGMKKKEVCCATIGDIRDKSNSSHIETLHEPTESSLIFVDGTAYNILTNYRKTLKKISDDKNNSPLFPNLYGEKGARQMNRLMKTYSESITCHIIRSAGIQNFNQALSTNKANKRLIDKKNTEKFRLSPRALKDQLKGTIKGPGRSTMSVQEKKDFETLLFFDKLSNCYHPIKIFDLCLEFYDHIKKYNFSDEDKNNLITIWEDNVFKQTSGKELSDKSKKNVDKLDMTKFMEMIHKLYSLDELDKELIEKEYKKMNDYFFPTDKNSFLK